MKQSLAMRDVHIFALRNYQLMLKGATLALNPSFPHEPATGSWAVFLTSKPQFLPPHNGVIDSTHLKGVMRMK